MSDYEATAYLSLEKLKVSIQIVVIYLSYNLDFGDVLLGPKDCQNRGITVSF